MNNKHVDELMKIIKGEISSHKVYLMELGIDPVIIKEYIETYLGLKWVDYSKSNLENRKKYWHNMIAFYDALGYVTIRVSNAFNFVMNIKNNNNRGWIDQNGKIHDEQTFNEYPWPSINDLDLWDYDYVASILPSHMGMLVCIHGGIFEMISEYLIGFEDLCFMRYDNPVLLKTIINKVGSLLLDAYKVIFKKVKRIVGVFQGDDFGFTEGLLFDKEFFIEYILPWHQELINLTHQYNGVYIMHSCGNLRDLKDEIMKLKIDAKHSFEDKGWSVIDFSNEFGKKVSIIGGVDVDKLTRLPLDELKKYCHNILTKCHPFGRYIYGSGNSIPNYVSLERFLVMLGEAKKYEQEIMNEKI